MPTEGSLAGRIGRIGAAVALVATVNGGLVACSSPGSDSGRRDGTTTTLAPIEAWNSLSALDRIHRLEQKQTLPIPLDPTAELVRSTAEFYCEQVACNKTSQELATSVRFMDTEEFLDEYEKEKGERLSPEDKAKVSRESIEIVTDNDRRVLFNKPALDNLISRSRAAQPDIAANLAGRDFAIAVMQSILFHAYGHQVNRDEVYDFSNFKYVDPQITLDKFDGFEVITEERGGGRGIIDGLEEAFPELIAILIQKKIDPRIYFSVNPDYRFGALLIGRINKAIGLSDEEFLRVYNTPNFMQEITKRWLINPSSRSSNDVILALSVLGAYVDNEYSTEEARVRRQESTQAFIENALGVKL